MTKRIEGDERARVRAEWEARLGRRRVWFVDDPGVAEVIGSAEDLALLECIRAATRPLTLADLVDAGHLQPGPSSDRLDRLERAGFIEYRQERPGTGFVCVDPVVTIVLLPDCDGATRDVMERYRAMTTRHNDAVVEASGELAERIRYFDRILRLTDDEMTRLEVAIARIAADARRAEDGSAGRPPECDERGPIRLQLSVTHLEAETAALAPVYFMPSDHPYNSTVMNSAIDRLTPRQREVAELIISGETNGVIAERLGVSENTVKSAVREIYRRLGVDSRADLVRVLKG